MEKYADINHEKELFLNRELSWLAFNERILEEAYNEKVPLLERLKFLSISADNLDEFYMVRVAGLKNQVGHDIEKTSIDGLTPSEQLEKIHKNTIELQKKQQNCWKELKKELWNNDILILQPKDYSVKQIEWLKNYFRTNIFPNLTPIAVSSSYSEVTSSFPFLSNRGVAVISNLNKYDDKNTLRVVTSVPQSLKRFIRLPDEDGSDSIEIVLLDDILEIFQGELFAGYFVTDFGMVRIIRDSELEFSDEADDLIRSFEIAIRRRKRGNLVLLEMNKNIPDSIASLVIDEFAQNSKIDENIERTNEFLGLSDIMALYDINRSDLKFKHHTIRFPERITDFGGDCFAAIESKDIVVHHPYESFDVVVRFINQAASDPYVTSIKQTLYRTSSDSLIVKALIKAADAGKSVTVVLEPKARFDEEANIAWGQGLERAGAQVIYGVSGLKIHAKVSLVVRTKDNETRMYVHYGTGNYHSITAKIYSDLSFFTCDEALCRDASLLFNFMTGYVPPERFEKLSVAPLTLRKTILNLIENEKEFADSGLPATIWIKVNSLIDKDLIEALYDASCHGVKIELIVRGMCCLRPGIHGLSENIKVKSIIGRFLEHSRIFCFGGGHELPSQEAKVFIASADLMPRNMERRVEIMVLIENRTVHEQILYKIMVANLRDENQSWIMHKDGSYTRMESNESSMSIFDYFISNPSLSGRGSAVHKSSDAKYLNSQDSAILDILTNSKNLRTVVLDIGSNSIRLVVYDGLKRVPLPIFNEKLLCGLAIGMEKTGNLNKEAVKQAKKVFERYVAIIKAMKVEQIYAFATSAVRDAKDGGKFINELEDTFKIKIQVLSGSEEARYAALGVACSSYEAIGIVGDLGGGSLELAKLTFTKNNTSKCDIENCDSFPIGPLRLKEIAKGDFDKGRKIIDDNLKEYFSSDKEKNQNFYAVGGAFRALAKIHIHRTDYSINIIQHYTISSKDIKETLNFVLSGELRKTRKIFKISEKRSATLSFAALIIERIIFLGKPSKIIFSTHGVREGVLFDKLSENKKDEDALISGCADMIRYVSADSSSEHENGWVEFGRKMHEWIEPLFSDKTKCIIRLRHAACILGRIAWYEHTEYRAEMAFRWVLDAELQAISHEERIYIATAIFHRYQTSIDKSITGKAQKQLTRKLAKQARITGLAMKLAYRISGGVSDILLRTRIYKDSTHLILSFEKDAISLLGGDVVKRLEKLADVMNLDVKTLTHSK